MKVKFLRNYGKNKIGVIEEIIIDEKEEKYLLGTHTIEILEPDEQIEKVPVVKTGTKRSGKKEADNE